MEQLAQVPQPDRACGPPSSQRRGHMIVPAIVSLTGHRRFHPHATGIIGVGGQGMMRHAALEPRDSRNALQREGDDE